MKYLFSFIIWTLYVIVLVILKIIEIIITILWDFDLNSLKNIHIFDGSFYRGNSVYKGQWCYVTYFDALADNKKYL